MIKSFDITCQHYGFWFFTSAVQDSLMKGKYPTLYVSSFCSIQILINTFKEIAIIKNQLSNEEIPFRYKYFKRDTANISVSIFVIPQEFWFVMYRCKINPTLYVSFSTIIFKNIMIKIVDIICQNYHFWVFFYIY